jgi:hypothetical protein
MGRLGKETEFWTESIWNKVTWTTSGKLDSEPDAMAGFGISGVETFGSNVQTVNKFMESL